MKTPEIDNSKLAEVKELIDKAATLMENQNGVRPPELDEVESRLRQLTGKPGLDAAQFREYWGWTSLDEAAKIALTPEPKKSGLSDEELTEIITKICKCEYSEAETDHYLKLLKLETGLKNISDYIFYPNLVGLDMRAEVPEIIAKILEDRKA